MSTSLWIIIAVITIISIIIFKKTVSSDAENDFKIRDILSGNSYEEEPEPTPQPIKTQKNIEADYLNPQKNIYEEIEELEHKHNKHKSILNQNKNTQPKHTTNKSSIQKLKTITNILHKILTNNHNQKLCLKKNSKT